MTDESTAPDPYFTPLNIATSQRHAACIAAGGHVRSDEIIYRDGGVLDNQAFTICARCRVPFTRKQITYNNRDMQHGRPVGIAL